LQNVNKKVKVVCYRLCIGDVAWGVLGYVTIDELNEAQQARLQQSIQQAQNGQVISDEAFKQRFAKWLAK